MTEFWNRSNVFMCIECLIENVLGYYDKPPINFRRVIKIM